MSKFKVGDLVTDKRTLVQIIDNEKHYTIKEIIGPHQGKVTDVSQHWTDELCVKYDLDYPLTKSVNNGKCYCNECGAELHYGDECARYDGDIYCNENCLMEYIDNCSEYNIIGRKDLDDSSTIERPLFTLTKEQIEEIKKVKS